MSDSKIEERLAQRGVDHDNVDGKASAKNLERLVQIAKLDKLITDIGPNGSKAIGLIEDEIKYERAALNIMADKTNTAARAEFMGQPDGVGKLAKLIYRRSQDAITDKLLSGVTEAIVKKRAPTAWSFDAPKAFL